MGWCCGKKSGMGAGVVVAVFLPVYLGMVVLANQDDERRSDVVVSTLVGDESPVETEQEMKMSSKDVLGYEFEMLDGSTRSLEDFRGSVVMFVNVASACGLTPQYEGLEAMYQKYKDDGFVIVGFPANEFGAQEPGTNEEIALFCSNEYGVTFPMAGKIVVKGDGVHPLYAQLAAQPEPIGGEPEWNFAKFLVNRKGEVVMRFPSRTAPEDAGLVSAVEGLLGEE
jgi:glutathione peroxidase